MPKIPQASLQQYMNRDFLDVQAGFRKGRETRDQIANIRWIIEKAREYQKKIYFCFVMLKPLTVWTTTNCGKFLRRWEYQTTLSASWKTNIQFKKQQNWTWNTDWSKTEKGVRQGCILSPCLFDLNAEYIMQNARLDESQAGIKIAGININNLRYTDDTLMAE